jgi:hypothetical protein
MCRVRISFSTDEGWSAGAVGKIAAIGECRKDDIHAQFAVALAY